MCAKGSEKMRRMHIGLMDVDGHNFPNLALMKLSAYHKQEGDRVTWHNGYEMPYDIVYKSKVFDATYSDDVPDPFNSDTVIKGGTGYGLDNYLPAEIEHCFPDYSIYPTLTQNTAFGFLTRGCPRSCKFCIVSKKEGKCSRKVANLSEFWDGQKTIELLDPNLLACNDRESLLEQLVKSKAWINFNQGLDIRFTDKDIAELLNRIKVKSIHFAWDNPNDDLYNKFKSVSEILKYSISKKIVYVLVNFNSTFEQDLWRVYTLRELGYDPYIMVYDRPNASKDIRRLQRWCNNRFIYKSCPNFSDYRG